MASDDIETIKKDMEELQKSLYSATSAFIKSGAQPGAGEAGQQPGSQAGGPDYGQAPVVAPTKRL